MCLVLEKDELKRIKKQRANSVFISTENTGIIIDDSNRRCISREPGEIIFDFLKCFYFFTLMFIVGAVLYIMIFKGFNSMISYYIIIIVPSSLVLSLLLYNIRDCFTYLRYFPAYVYYIATYINILQIYSICKTDDVSWGTEPGSKKDEEMSNSRSRAEETTYEDIEKETFMSESNMRIKKEKDDKKKRLFKYKKVLYLILYIASNSAFGFCFQK
jgi:hypothetical protein